MKAKSMSKRTHVLCIVMLLLLMCVVMPTTALASGNSGTYVGEDFVIRPGSYPSLAGGDDTAELINVALGRTQIIAAGITGACALVAFVAMVIAITKLVTSGDDARLRHNAIIGIAISGVSLALLGSSTMVIVFFWNLFVPGTSPALSP